MYNIKTRPIIIDIKSRRCESFTVPETTINAAILFACFKINEHDYAFIEKWYKDIDFYVVVNGEPTEWDSKVIELIGNDRYLNRENKGYDAGAWKAGIYKWKEHLNGYDLVGLVNNSCIYKVNLHSIFLHANDYDLYSLGQTLVQPFIWFLNAYFIVISKRLFTSDDFMKYWDKLPNTNGYVRSATRHEWRFANHFKRLGYKCGVYDITRQNAFVYAIDKEKHDKYHREFIKNKTIRKNPDALNKFNEKVPSG